MKKWFKTQLALKHGGATSHARRVTYRPGSSTTPVAEAAWPIATGGVTLDDLVVMVDIALGSATVSICLAGDANDDGSVTINEIIAAGNTRR